MIGLRVGKAGGCREAALPSLCRVSALLVLACMFAALLFSAAACPLAYGSQRTLVVEDGKTHCYESGSLVTSAWKTIDGKRYYFKANGDAAVGSEKISSKYYVFSDEGVLFQPSKSSVVSAKGSYYYVNKHGQPAKTGWVVLSGKLYKFKKSGKANASTTVQGITFTANGSAKVSLASNLKIATMKRVASLTSAGMSKSAKLKRCFAWLDNLKYTNSVEPKDIGARHWAQRCALKVLKSGKAECFGDACVFAMLAYEIGYKDVKVIVADKSWSHGYTRINGKKWDRWGGWRQLAGISGEL